LPPEPVSDIDPPDFNPIDSFELVLALVPKPCRTEEHVSGVRIRAFERELLQVLRQLPIVRGMHGGEDFRGDNLWGHAFDVGTAGGAKVKAKAAWQRDGARKGTAAP